VLPNVRNSAAIAAADRDRQAQIARGFAAQQARAAARAAELTARDVKRQAELKALKQLAAPPAPQKVEQR